MRITTVMKISEDDYNKLLQLSKEDAWIYIADVAENSPFPPCGYGFSDPNFYEENGRHFVSWKRWGSCD